MSRLGEIDSSEFSWKEAGGLQLLAILALGVGLRLYHLDALSLWGDEAFSLVVSALPLGELYDRLVADYVHPPLHYFLLHAWGNVFGFGELASRSLALVFGIACLPLQYRLAREVCEPAAARIATLLLALSQLGVMYSQEARPYSQLLFFMLLGTILCLRAVRRREERTYWAFVVCATLLLCTHYYALFTLIGLAIWLLWPGPVEGIPFPKLLAGGLVVGAVLALWLLSGPLAAALASDKVAGNVPGWFTATSSSLASLLGFFSNGRVAGVMSGGPAAALAVSGGLFVAPALAASVPASWRSGRIPWPWVGGLALVALGFGLVVDDAWFWGVLLSLAIVAHRLPDLSPGTASLRRALQVVYLLGIAAAVVLAQLNEWRWISLPYPPYWLLFGVGAVAGASVYVSFGRASSMPSRQAERSAGEPATARAMVLVWVCPIAGALGLGALGLQYDGRYALASLPPFYVLVALGLSKLEAKPLRAAWVALAVAWSAVGLWAVYRVPYKENFRDALAFVRGELDAGECLAVGPHQWTMPAYWQIYHYDDGAPAFRLVDGPGIEAGAPGCDRLWLVLYERTEEHRSDGRAIEAGLHAAGLRDAEARDFHWVRVRHLERAAGGRSPGEPGEPGEPG